jgi:hypothetical protein
MIKKITLGITLFFSTLMIASPAYADWEKVTENEIENTFYVDFDRMRKNGGYVYWWHLVDRLEPSDTGTLSYKVYNQGDCEMFRFKNLSFSYYKQPMGEGSGSTDSTPDTEWNYPPPNTPLEIILKRVCDYAENL